MFAAYQDDLSSQIAITALAIFAGVVVVVSIAGSLFRFLPTSSAAKRSVTGDLLGMGFVVFLPGLVAAGGAVLVTPILLALSTPLAVWIALAVGAAGWSVAAMRESHDSFKGCISLLMVGVFGYFAIWAGTATVLLYRPSSGLPPLSQAARIALFCVPVASWVATKSRKGQRLATATAAGVAIAIILAAVFVPVERGFAQSLLPRSDWLRFPAAGALAAAVMGILIDWRVNRGARGDKVTASLRLKFHTFFTACGALVGLIWAGLHQLSEQF